MALLCSCEATALALNCQNSAVKDLYDQAGLGLLFLCSFVWQVAILSSCRKYVSNKETSLYQFGILEANSLYQSFRVTFGAWEQLCVCMAV